MNPAQGEITLLLAGARYVLRPSFGALMALEAELGVGLVTLARKFAHGEFRLADLVAVVEAGIKGAGGVPPADLGAAIAEAGIATLAQPVGAFLTAALVGEDTAPKA